MSNCIPSKLYLLQGPRKTLKFGRSKDPHMRARKLCGFAGGRVCVIYESELVDYSTIAESIARADLAQFTIGDEDWMRVDVPIALRVIKESLVAAREMHQSIVDRSRVGGVKINTLHAKYRWGKRKT